MKRIFEVTVTKTILVLAEDEREAELEAGTYESEEDGSIDVLGEVTSIDRVPEEWKDALPFGDQEGDLTVRQILEVPPPPAPPYDHPDQLKFGFLGGAQPT